MILDLLVSLSSMFFTSVVGADSSGNMQISTKADLVDALGGVYQGKFVPREKISDLAKEKLKKEDLVVEILSEVEKKLPDDFNYPPIKEAIKFRDISPENSVYDKAQKLRSLEILPQNNGFFGDLNNKNPQVSIKEMKQVLQNAFDKKGNLNYLSDKDRDGIPNSLDACPDLSGTDGGCPKKEKQTKLPEKSIIKVSDDYKTIEEQEIKIGDKFSAIIFDKITGEIFTKSNSIIVEK